MIRRAAFVGFFAALGAMAARAAEEKISFNEHIRPILSDNCFACHGTDEKNRKAHRRLDTPEGAYAESKGFQAFVPRDLANSEAWQRIISTDDEERMPPPDSHKPALKPEQRALIQRWIEQGAVYQKHWSYEPIARPSLPPAAGGAGEHPVDRFVGQKLAARQLALAPEAPRELLLRRVTLDLTGLPPTVDELDAFLADRAPGAYERVVDRLLASPRFGEHFARGWLDAVRYGDTNGLHFDNARTIWPYRDWVVRAFNDNKPFDQFTIDQLAGDLLPNPRIDQLVATGYLRSQLTTNEGGAIADEVLMRYTNDRADTTAGAWLGLTTNCASCHDHKFDPLKQKEYYQLGAFFRGLADKVWDGNARVPGPFVVITDAAQQKRLDSLDAALPALRAALAARAAPLFAAAPPPKKGPVTYEVVWADDGDVPMPADFGPTGPAALPGEWRAGEGVPLVSGQRALRLEGAIERPINFAAGDVPLAVGKAARAFISVNVDPAKPPRAISLAFIAGTATKRVIWGDPKAFAADAAASAIVAGPLPLAGTYLRLEIDAADTGLAAGANYTGLRIAQSDGATWWDRAGVVCVSAEANKDPLLSVDAWEKAHWNETVRDAANIPQYVAARLRLPDYFQDEDDRRVLGDYFRDFVYGPLRGALEPESLAARRVLAGRVQLEQTLPLSLIARELPVPRPAHVLLRGQYDKLGEPVQPATPAFLPPLKASGPRASRLDLARWLVDGENPLVPRVIVNRFWQQVFGEGLVRTPGDFGTQGDPPTHLDLHNWLAAEFVESGWNVKALVRLLVTSRTYRQSSDVLPALLELDPANKLLARVSRVRLDGEVIRDQALALGGLLVPTIGGPPVRPYQPPGIWEPVAFPDSNTRSYVQDHGAALYRRSLYTFWKRTAPPPAFTTFDAPSRESFCTRRGRSDTPLQSLALMNDVQQFEAARAFAERLLARPGDEAARLAEGFRCVTARPPKPGERTLLADALAAQRDHFAKHPEAAREIPTNGESRSAFTGDPVELAAWTMVASLLLNLDETVTRN
jgi:cytochrome c553